MMSIYKKIEKSERIEVFYFHAKIAVERIEQKYSMPLFKGTDYGILNPCL